MIAQPLNAIEPFRLTQNTCVDQSVQRWPVRVAVINLVQDPAVSVLKRRYRLAVVVTQAVREAERVHAIDDIPVAFVHSDVGQQGAVEVDRGGLVRCLGLGLRRVGAAGPVGAVGPIQELNPSARGEQNLGREPIGLLPVLAPAPRLQLAGDVDQTALPSVLELV